MHRLLFRPTLFALALSAAACRDGATDAIAPRAARPSFGLYNAEAPVPVPVSAVRDSARSGFDYVTITFLDDAVDETMVSAYFSGGADFAVTQNIVGTPTTGQRSAVVAIPSGYLDVQLRYLWNATPEIRDSQTWGPFSSKIAVTGAATLTTTNAKGKGNRR
jgi:hypothetical protein